MSFSLESIRSKVVSERVFVNGRRMAEEGHVTLGDIAGFWKGETEVKGTVVSGLADNEDRISTKLVISEGNIRSYSCNSCDKGYGMCVHATATAFAYYRHLYQNTAMRTSTSQFMKDAMDSYIRRRVYEEMKNEQGEILLLPKITVTDSRQSMFFKVSNGKVEYTVSDLGEFYNRVKNEAEYEYGKALVLRHDMLAFEAESRKLLKILLAAIEEEINISQDYQAKGKAALKQKNLNLKRSYMNDIAEYIVGKTVEIEFPDKSKKQMFFEKRNPEISILVKEALMGGYRLETDRPMYAFMFGSRLCVCNLLGEACICDNEYTEAMATLLIKMNANVYREENFTISKRDMALFCGQMLPVIKNYVKLNTGSLKLEAEEASKLSVEFKFDLNSKNEIVCRETLSYGEVKLNPAKGGSVPVGIYRDYAKEYKIKIIVEKYLSTEVDEEGNLIVKGEDAIFKLLEEGLAQLMEVGNVFVSDRFKSMRVSPAPKLSVGARMNESMLELDVELGEFDKEELKSLLESYRLRKKYYRLKNGDFVRIEDNSLSVISELSEALNLNGDEFDKITTETILIPKYRALYIDSILNQAGDIQLYRDKNLRQLVRGMKEMADSDYEVPDTLKGVLRKYQRTGYRWLRTLAENGFGGILADDMGLGKTLQVITLLLADKEKMIQEDEDKPTLIVCPASLVYNWENEIKKFAPQLTSLVISGTAEERKELLKQVSGREIIITSYDSLRRDMKYYQNIEFVYEVIDEAQFIKNPATQNAKSVKEIKARSKFALTGTPIENRLSELWSIFDYLMPGFLYSYTRFRDELENRIIRDEDGIALKRLQNMIKPFILRRLKSEVLKDLPEKQEAVVYSKMEGEQKKVYNAMVLQVKEDILNMSEETFGAERMNVLAKLMRLRQICCDPSLCYENFTDLSAKLETCLELVRGAIDSGHKILLFSQFTTMLDKIAERFSGEGISYYMLTGETPKEERIKLSEEFNVDDTKVFLISLKAGGTGLNLTGADIVIHYDPWWNVAVQNQATDRAHRIGQLRKVNVYKLIAKNSIEEKILKLQEGKERLANQVVSEEVSRISAFTKDELLKLLE